MKAKNINIEEAIVATYTKPREGRKHFGALISGVCHGRELMYIDIDGTGFSDSSKKGLWNKLKPFLSVSSPFSETVKVNAPVSWLKHDLECGVEFTEKA